MWDFRNQRVTEVSLFSSHTVPGITSRHEVASDEELAEESSLPNAEPLLYIGLCILFIICIRCFFVFAKFHCLRDTDVAMLRVS